MIEQQGMINTGRQLVQDFLPFLKIWYTLVAIFNLFGKNSRI